MSRVAPFDPPDAFCDVCNASLEALATEQLRGALFWSPTVPELFSETHVICGHCHDFYRQGGPLHRSPCPLEQADLSLVTAGWATPFSIGLRTEIRRTGSRWIPIAARILADAVADRATGNHLICAIPMSSEHGEGLEPVARLLADQLGLETKQAITRHRESSARQSGQIDRRRIAEDEYQIDVDAEVVDRNVMVIDDNVTTGETMAGVARKLLSAGAAAVLPVSIDRTISTRFGQRLLELHPLGCPHKSG